MSYAQHGHVRDLKVGPGKVEAKVSGRRTQPYKVTIQLRTLTQAQWKKVIEMLGDRAAFTANLLAGEMPERLTEVFEQCGLSLFPRRIRELKTSCSCPDWANPCKHIAAVYYLLGERFDADPFLLFELRGRSEAEIAAALRERRAVELKAADIAPAAPVLVDAIKSPALEDCLDRYWTWGSDVGDIPLEITQPSVSFALLKRVGLPSFEGIEPRNFQRQMERVYDGVTEAAIRLAFAEPGE